MKNNTLNTIIEILNDRQYHNGTEIGDRLKITRAAIWKSIKKLQAYNIPISSRKGKGYRLEMPLILLDKTRIQKALTTAPTSIVVLEKVNSTNHYLRKIASDSKHPIVVLAETQTSGKGRMNRQWHSPFGHNIYLSLSYHFEQDISQLAGLSLVTSLAVCKAIEAYIKTDLPLTIKWPNDIIVDQKKLAGILIEIQAESNGFCRAIIGIGLNVNLTSANQDEINQPWTSLQQLTDNYCDRNILAAVLVDQLLSYLQRFQENGLNAFTEEWKTKDALLNQSVSLNMSQKTITGIAAGINQQGHLQLKLPNGQTSAFSSGDASIMKNTGP